MFESIFTSTSENTISISQSMLGILVAVVIGLVIAFVYTLVSKKDGYNKSFIIGLALLPAIVASVILLVGSNIFIKCNPEIAIIFLKVRESVI